MKYLVVPVKALVTTSIKLGRNEFIEIEEGKEYSLTLTKQEIENLVGLKLISTPYLQNREIQTNKSGDVTVLNPTVVENITSRNLGQDEIIDNDVIDIVIPRSRQKVTTTENDTPFVVDNVVKDTRSQKRIVSEETKKKISRTQKLRYARKKVQENENKQKGGDKE